MSSPANSNYPGQSRADFGRDDPTIEAQIQSLTDTLYALIEPMRFYDIGDDGNGLHKADVVTDALSRVIARVSVEYAGEAYWKEQDTVSTETAVDIFKAMAVHHGKSIAAGFHLRENPGAMFDDIRRHVTIDDPT